jgi:UDP-GlcNAc:undecaprenyl-phosphate GlcNAc-1-phosphate transferase
LGLTPQGAIVLPAIGAFAGVLVAVLMHIGWTAQSGVFWVAAGTLVVVLLLLRVPVYGARRPVPTQAGRPLSTQAGGPPTQAGKPVSTQVGRSVSSQVSGHLRVRNG